MNECPPPLISVSSKINIIRQIVHLRQVAGIHSFYTLPQSCRVDQPVVDEQQEDHLLDAVVHVTHPTLHLELVPGYLDLV